MNKVGDFLSHIFNSTMQDRAKKASAIFTAWEQLAKELGIASAANHSQIQDIQRGILFINTDHPGWIQILQTKEHEILLSLQKQFPELGISGIAFKLSNSFPEAAATVDESPAAVDTQEESRPAESGYDKIKDTVLVEYLKSLENTLKQKKGAPGNTVR